jgi:hypothetical protein
MLVVMPRLTYESLYNAVQERILPFEIAPDNLAIPLFTKTLLC